MLTAVEAAGDYLGAYCMYIVLVFAYAYAILVPLYAWESMVRRLGQ